MMPNRTGSPGRLFAAAVPRVAQIRVLSLRCATLPRRAHEARPLARPCERLVAAILEQAAGCWAAFGASRAQAAGVEPGRNNRSLPSSSMPQFLCRRAVDARRSNRVDVVCPDKPGQGALSFAPRTFETKSGPESPIKRCPFTGAGKQSVSLDRRRKLCRHVMHFLERRFEEIAGDELLGIRQGLVGRPLPRGNHRQATRLENLSE